MQNLLKTKSADEKLRHRGCKFMVAGRYDAEAKKFLTLRDVQLDCSSCLSYYSTSAEEGPACSGVQIELGSCIQKGNAHAINAKSILFIFIPLNLYPCMGLFSYVKWIEMECLQKHSSVDTLYASLKHEPLLFSFFLALTFISLSSLLHLRAA
eukprot:scaffold29545_cov19-Tisochrysis_lutea.AAC.1